MSKDNYIGIIQDQRRSLYELMEEAVVPRRPMERIELLHPCAQVVVGMRRCGKSVLCRMALKAHPEIKFGYIDFDDEKLRDVQPDDLNDILEAVYVVYGEDIQLLFMDEIQDVPAWELFVNRLLKNRHHLLITGSNSKLLSSELATHLTGRHIPIELFSFSFLEYRQFLKRGPVNTTVDRAQLRRDYDRYFDCGGLPETFGMADVRGYVPSSTNYYQKGDVIYFTPAAGNMYQLATWKARTSSRRSTTILPMCTSGFRSARCMRPTPATLRTSREYRRATRRGGVGWRISCSSS